MTRPYTTARLVRAASLLLAAALLFPSVAAAADDEPRIPPAQVKVSGYGFFGNRALKRTIRSLELAPKGAEILDASFVEDSALVLLAQIRRDGYLSPEIRIDIEQADGARLQVPAAELLEHPLPRPLEARKVHFQVRKGPLYNYRNLRFEGLNVMREKDALPYFIETGAFLTLKNGRIFTPERLRRSILNLTDALNSLGYRDAVVTNSPPRMNDRNGNVDVTILVHPRQRYIVRSVTEQFESHETPRPPAVYYPEKPYSRLWNQDFSQMLKTNLYASGFPDVAVAYEPLREQNPGGSSDIVVDLLATIDTGHKVRVGDVIIRGHEHTRLGFLRRRVRVERGELLDPMRIERARFRLAQLGAFDSVGLEYAPVDEHLRDVIFQLRESERFTLSVLLGWGSYEMLRGGFEGNFNNIWGLAHRAQLRLIQSLKSSSGDFTYTVPDFTQRDLDLFVNGFALRREEVSFTREEFGGGMGVHKYFRRYATDASLRYNYQVLNAASIVPEVESEGLINPSVGSFIAEVRYDRRDNPLYPRKGLKLFAIVETANEAIAGEANYERVELLGSWHLPLGAGTWLSLGVSHGVAVSPGEPADNLPFNKRFFPGGANSIRGFQEGEASPRNEMGEIVGAESTLLGTLELEQAITRKWSLVVFGDALGIARRMDDYPFDDTLFSVGGGLRWRTIIGPVRVEYGHNLNPRPRDPSGTLHFSIGYPF